MKLIKRTSHNSLFMHLCYSTVKTNSRTEIAGINIENDFTRVMVKQKLFSIILHYFYHYLALIIFHYNCILISKKVLRHSWKIRCFIF